MLFCQEVDALGLRFSNNLHLRFQQNALSLFLNRHFNAKMEQDWVKMRTNKKLKENTKEILRPKI
jgi:hypothetical protein